MMFDRVQNICSFQQLVNVIGQSGPLREEQFPILLDDTEL